MLIGFLLFLGISCEKKISEKDLPSAAKTYLEAHFPTCSILKIIKDKENKELSYDITLDCGVNIEFNGDGQPIDIDGTSQSPNSVIPGNILDYTTTHYPNDYIIGWELEKNNQRVDLNTKVVLEFDMNGDFLKIVN